MSEPTVESILFKIDVLERTIATTVARAKRRSFWLGWALGFVAAELGRWP